MSDIEFMIYCSCFASWLWSWDLLLAWYYGAREA